MNCFGVELAGPLAQPAFVQNAVGWAVLASCTVGRIDCLGYRIKGD